jgi:hypothetical protein
MSANRNDILSQLARGMRKFENVTAGEFVMSKWAGLSGLHSKDVKFFQDNKNLNVLTVARLCMRRSAANGN